MCNIHKEDYPLYLVEIPDQEKETLCTRLAALDVTLVEDIRGMVMMSAIDCFDTPFHIGEVLVRQVRVELDGRAGIGMAMGDSYSDAFITAAAEAAAAAGNKDVIDLIAQMIGDNARFRAEAVAFDRGIAETTKVQFGLMVEG